MPETGERLASEILKLPHGNVEIVIVPEAPQFNEFSDNASYPELQEFIEDGGKVK